MNVHVYISYLLISTIWPYLLQGQFCSSSQPKVKTKIGTVCGISTEIIWKDRPASTVNIFYGIPFAKPPIRNLRFKKPVPITETTNQNIFINASSHKSSCHQYNDTNYITNPAAKMWVSPIRYDEDCLYLNVWVPQPSATGLYKSPKQKKKLAVMVWIYGGSFAMGSSALEVYEARYLAARQNVIVVSMNYRVGPFGFLYLRNNDVPGNMGLWDQRMALKWVKDNIEAFGGDSNRITLFGESAGAVSVSAHVVSPWSQNLFKNAIMESGSVFSYWGLVSNTTSFNNTLQFIKKLGCTRSTLANSVECMRQLTSKQLTDKHYTMYNPESYFSVPFPPVVENKFFPYRKGQDFRSLAHLKPSGSLMLGMNKNEGSYFMLYAFLPNSSWSDNQTRIKITRENSYEKMLKKILDLQGKGVDNIPPLVDFEYTNLDLPNSTKYKIQRLEDISSDRSFKCPTIDMAREVINEHRRRGKGSYVTLPVYFYEFRYRTKSLTWPNWMGTIHGLEIDFVFGVPFNEKFQREFYSYNDRERELSDQVMQYWANFARTGDPNIMPDDVLVTDPSVLVGGRQMKLWPEFDNFTESFIVFKDEGGLKVSQHPKRRKCLFWRRWYPAILMEAKKQMDLKCRG